MEIHHGKHHQAYINNVNAALEGHADLAALSVEALVADLDRVPEAKRTAVRNNGGGHANHSLFWTILSPQGGGEPGGALGEAIADSLGGFAEFKAAFEKAGMTRFGTYWVEGGELIAPVSVMRFDDSLYHLFGDRLVGLTRERDLLLSAETYGGRSSESCLLPGALVDGLTLTL